MDSISSNDQIEYLFHHIFLPPKLPGGDDMSTPNTMYLTNFVLHTLQRFATELGEKDTAVVQPVISMLQTMPFMTDSNGLDHVGVQKALRCLSFDSKDLPYFVLMFPTNNHNYRPCRSFPYRCAEFWLAYSQNEQLILLRNF